MARFLWMAVAPMFVVAACGPSQSRAGERQSPFVVVSEEEGPTPGSVTSTDRALEHEGYVPPTAEVISLEADGAPEGTDAFAARLRSHHAEDVPTGADVAALADAAGTLLAIEANAQTLGERSRALRMMRYVNDERVTSRLLALLADDSAHVAVRESAVFGLEASVAGGNEDARAALDAAAQSSEARVRTAAERVLSNL